MNDIFTKLDKIVADAEKATNEAFKEYGEAFTSCVRLDVQNVPLSDFNVIAKNQNISIKPYDVSEGTDCLVARLRFGSWGEVWISTNEITEATQPKDTL